MFPESLLDSAASRGRRGWSTLLSYALELIFLAIVLTLPLLRSVALPGIAPPHIFIAVGPPEAQTSNPTPHSGGTHLYSTRPVMLLHAPVHVPIGVHPPQNADTTASPPGPYVPGLNANGDSAMMAVLSNPSRAVPLAMPSRPRVTGPVKVSSGVSSGFLLHDVKPVYPPLAVATHTQGAVVLAAVIDRNGTIAKLRVVSGHPLLVRAAIDAVSQWRYRPYLLNGEPVEVETQITVNFVLGR